MADCIARALRPWRARTPLPAPFTSPVLCEDAAEGGAHFQVGIFGPMVGGRIVCCPGNVNLHQQAELFAVDAATRLAVRLGWSHITYVGGQVGLRTAQW